MKFGFNRSSGFRGEEMPIKRPIFHKQKNPYRASITIGLSEVNPNLNQLYYFAQFKIPILAHAKFLFKRVCGHTFLFVNHF